MKSRARKRWAIAAAALLGFAALAWVPVTRHLAAARLLAGVEDAGAAVDGVEVRDVTLAGLRARRYAIDAGPPVLLVHGVHQEGIDEPRLVRFAALLARSGLVVVTPELPALTRFRLEASSADRVGAAARALAEDEGVASVGVVGISFGGGLALIAAAEHPEVIHAVWAIGAHHDARRLARWWRGELVSGPDGVATTPSGQRYGAQVLAVAYADEWFGDDADAARRALEAMLVGDRAAMADRLAALPPGVREEIDRLRHGRALGASREALARIADAHAEELAAVSPVGRLGGVRARVFLLHGRDDPVIAPTETAWIASELPSDRLGGALVTPLIGHAETGDASGIAARWDVVRHAAAALHALR